MATSLSGRNNRNKFLSLEARAALVRGLPHFIGSLFRIFAAVISRLIAFVVLLFPLWARAQRSLSFAPAASFDFGSPLFINRAPGVLNPFGGSGNGTSSSTSYGVGAQAVGPEWIAPHFDLLGRLEAVYTTGHFTFDATPNTVTGSEAKLLLEAGAQWETSAIGFNAGPWITQTLVRNISETNFTPSNAGSPYTHEGVFAGIVWNIPDFPVQPTLTTHLDLSQLRDAGSNAWSFGISLSYKFATAKSGTEHAFLNPNSFLRDTAGGPTPPRVKFLVDGSEASGNPPLDREELHVTQYTMMDAPDVSPKVERWITRSYHLPKLSVVYSDRGVAILRVTSGQKQLFYKALVGSSPDGMSILPLSDSEWERSILELRSDDTNRLVAELRLDSLIARDTLVFPPADSTTTGAIITKHESRFRLLTNYAHNAGGAQVLELLLERMQALAEENPKISISTPTGSTSLLTRLHTTLGDEWHSVNIQQNSVTPYVTVILDY